MSQQVALQMEACSLPSTGLPGQGKAILDEFITPVPYQWKQLQENHSQSRGNFNLENCCFSQNTVDHPLCHRFGHSNYSNTFRVFQLHKSRNCIYLCPRAHLWTYIYMYACILAQEISRPSIRSVHLIENLICGICSIM